MKRKLSMPNLGYCLVSFVCVWFRDSRPSPRKSRYLPLDLTIPED